jgi:hypothetical protein
VPQPTSSTRAGAACGGQPGEDTASTAAEQDGQLLPCGDVVTGVTMIELRDDPKTKLAHGSWATSSSGPEVKRPAKRDASSSTLEAQMSELLTIGELARRTGVTTSALRYYDELGLVQPTRRVSGHRRYAVDAVAAVGVVRFFQEVGFMLAETKRLIASGKRSPVA